MQVSTKGRYALRLMLDLAVHDTGENISLKSIAQRQEISEKYLEQIIGILTKAGFVRSMRGAGGGYRLARAAGSWCVEEGAAGCSRAGSCVTMTVWKEINDAINGVVDRITLADLVERQASMGSDYSI